MRTENYLETLVQRLRLPYIDVIAYQNHRPIFRWYGGDGREHVDGHEKLFLYSATKPLTAVCALRLCEDKILSLDDPVADWLPRFRDVYLNDSNGQRHPPATEMKIIHLLTMTAGFTYDYRSYPIDETVFSCSGIGDTQTVVGAFVKKPLSFCPGTQFQYSLCHDILAAVIEQAAGMRFSAYMQKTIFHPLGMHFSDFSTDVAEHAPLYMCTESGNIEKVHDPEYPIWMVFGNDYESGGAGASSTAEDYIRFADVMACGGLTNTYQLLQKETVKSLYREYVSNLTIHNTFTCIQGNDYGYGLGVRTRLKPTSWGLPIGEFGWDGAAGSYVMMDPVHRISVFIGMHLDCWPRIFLGEHLKIVEALYNDMKVDQSP